LKGGCTALPCLHVTPSHHTTPHHTTPMQGEFQAILAADTLLPEGNGQALPAEEVSFLWEVARALGQALDRVGGSLQRDLEGRAYGGDGSGTPAGVAKVCGSASRHASGTHHRLSRQADVPLWCCELVHKRCQYCLLGCWPRLPLCSCSASSRPLTHPLMCVVALCC
jgi:hypothetical protein